MSSTAFQVSVFTGLEAVIIWDKDQNFIGRSSVTFRTVATLYLSDSMTLTYIYHKNIRRVASSPLPRDLATIAAPYGGTCCSIAHKTFRGETRLDAGLCQLHNSLTLLSVCLIPRAAAVSCTDRPTDQSSDQTLL